ncbi:MAG: chorismate lyase [Gammaproteobacteria bacterium]|nr:chorismate lyase [Gammaproteobacteria bacterium]
MYTLWRLPRTVPRASRPARILWHWLLDPASLTLRLQAVCGEFRVEVLRNAWARPTLDELHTLGLRPGQRALVREVHLLCDGRPWVFARTVIPRETLSGKYRRLARLGNRSLGAVLFADKTMRRADVHVACLTPAHRLYKHTTLGLKGKPPDQFWGRRSLFYLCERPLLLSEIFLHDMRPCKLPI